MNGDVISSTPDRVTVLLPAEKPEQLLVACVDMNERGEFAAHVLQVLDPETALDTRLGMVLSITVVSDTKGIRKPFPLKS